jgi:hypothetical protein
MEVDLPNSETSGLLVRTPFAFLKGLIKFSSQANLEGIVLIRGASKGFFDLVKNVAVVGALKYFSDKSSSPYIYWLYFASLMFLFGWVTSYCLIWELHLFSRLSWKRAGKAADAILTVVIGYALLLFCLSALETSIDSISAVQGR